MSVHRDELVDEFADSIGKKKAESVIDDASRTVGLRHKGELAEDEAEQLLDHISDAEGVDTLTRVTANTVKTQVIY